MKPLSAPELVSFCEWLQPQLFGSQLQDLWTDGETLLLQFYRQGEIYFVVRLAPNSPMIWLQSQRPRLKKSPKPVTQFLASHGRNKLVHSLEVKLEKGRAVLLTLSGRGETCEVEIDLIPKTPNLTVRWQDKKISWNKPRDLPAPILPETQVIRHDWRAWCEEARQFFFAAAGTKENQKNTENLAKETSVANSAQIANTLTRELENGSFTIEQVAVGQASEQVAADPGSGSAPDPESGPGPGLAPRALLSPEQKITARAIEKKKRALEAMQLQLDSGEADRYRALGESLKASSEVPPGLIDLYDENRTAMENLQRVFQKAKDLERKRQGTLERKAIIEKEIEKLQKNFARPPRADGAHANPANATASIATRAMKKGEAAGRKLQVEGFEAVIGKSGADNLAILRQARAWDFWLHLKDEPGAHAILFRNRAQEVPAHVIQKVAEWIWSESRGKKAILGQGKYEVLVVECRFVKPIKGDKLGRVNYTHPRVYTFASKGP